MICIINVIAVAFIIIITRFPLGDTTGAPPTVTFEVKNETEPDLEDTVEKVKWS